MRNTNIALGLLLAASAPAAAQNTGGSLPADPNESVTRVATRGLNFLQLGIGARALALGGAYTAMAEGVSASYWNPAGLSDITKFSAMASYQDLYAGSGLTNSYVSIGAPAGQGAVGLSITRFSSGEIQRTTEQYPDGFDPAFGTTVEWGGTAIAVHYARRVTDRLAFGLSAKYAQEGLDFVAADWVGADVGTLFRTGLLSSSLGLSISNLGGRSRMTGAAIDRKIAGTTRDPLFPTRRDLEATFRTGRLQMPTIFRFGVRTQVIGGSDPIVSGHASHRVTWLSELTDAIDGPISPALAAEYAFKERFFLRGSKRFLRDAQSEFSFSDGLAGGLGVRIPALGRSLHFDYAFQTLNPLGTSQSFSIELSF